MNLKQLVAAETQEVDWVIKGLWKPGAISVVGKPKVGKSGAALYMAICAATETPAFGQFPVGRRGDVVYISYEDEEADLQERATLQLAKMGVAPSDRLEIYDNWPRKDDGGLKSLEGLIQEYDGECMAVVIDDLRHFAPLKRSYNLDNDTIEEIDKVGRRNRCAIVLVAHQGKGRVGNNRNWDWMDRIQGSGTGAMRVIIGFQRDTGSNTGLMRVIGKGVPELAIELEWDGESGLWTAKEEPVVGEATAAQEELIAYVATHPGLTVPVIARRMNRGQDAVRQMVQRCVRATPPTLARANKRYYVPTAAPVARSPLQLRQTTMDDLVVIDGKTVRLPAVASEELTLTPPDARVGEWARQHGIDG
jgi:hypothetical protein